MLKKILISTLASAAVLSSSSFASGLVLYNDPSSGIDEITVTCAGQIGLPLYAGWKLPAFSWDKLAAAYGKSFSCTFSDNGSIIGTANVEINGNGNAATMGALNDIEITKNGTTINAHGYAQGTVTKPNYKSDIEIDIVGTSK